MAKSTIFPLHWSFQLLTLSPGDRRCGGPAGSRGDPDAGDPGASTSSAAGGAAGAATGGRVRWMTCEVMERWGLCTWLHQK